MEKSHNARTEQDISRERLNTTLGLAGLCSITLLASLGLWLNAFNWGSWPRIFVAIATAIVCIIGIVYAVLFQGAAINSSSTHTASRANLIGLTMVAFAVIALSLIALIIWQSYQLIVS